MDLSTFNNSKTIEIVNLASVSSAASPIRMVTSSSAKAFMNKSPKSKRHIDNVVNRIKATNQAREEQNTKINVPDKDTDYANIITIKKADPQVNPNDNNMTQQNPTAPQPQHSSEPIQQNNPQNPQTAEHDSTSDIENDPKTDTTTNHKDQPSHITDFITIPTSKTSEQSPISSLNTEDIEELNKLIFD